MRRGKLDHKLWRVADSDYGKWLQEAGAWGVTVKADLFGLSLMRGMFARPKMRRQIKAV
jgi:hypothetical protein